MLLPRKFRRPEPRATRRPGALLRRVVPLFLLLACRASAPEPGGPVVTPAGGASAQNELRALQAALAAGDEERASRLIDSLGSANLAREERAQLEGARKVLRGRALVAGLELTLASEEVAGKPGLYELVLRARNRSPGTLTLLLPPADLKRHRATIDARGMEGLELDSKLCTVFAELELPGGRESRFVILSYELPLGRALAVRERWRLVTRSGELEHDGQRYPAAGVAVAGCARERVSPLLGPGASDAEALAAALRADPPPSARALLERALALPTAEREATLQALAPLVSELARSTPERVLAAEPALRWLTENRDIGADAHGWARYLAQRSGPETSEGSRLDLP